MERPSWCICRGLSFTRPFFLGPMFLRTALPSSGGYHLERDGMPLHDVVRVCCKNGATTDIQAQAPSIWAKGCVFDDCGCVI